MLRIPVKHEIVLAAMAIALALCVHFLQATPALSITEVAAPGVTATEAISQPKVLLVQLAPDAIAPSKASGVRIPTVANAPPPRRGNLLTQASNLHRHSLCGGVEQS